jgi:hypothetical protein
VTKDSFISQWETTMIDRPRPHLTSSRRVGALIAAQKKSVGLNKGQLRRGSEMVPRENRELVPRIDEFNALRVLTPAERRLLGGFRTLSRACQAAVLTVVVESVRSPVAKKGGA